MIQCDACQCWFHGECVGIAENYDDKKEWYCSKCGPDEKVRARGFVHLMFGVPPVFRPKNGGG
jgi:hypothetical protein